MPPVRSSTLRHLETLLGLSAVAAMTANGDALAGEKKEKATVEPTTDPIGSLGYSVVDELPSPAICQDLASSLSAQASMTTSGHVVVRVLPLPGYDSVLLDGGSAEVRVGRATIVTRDAIPDTPGWAFELAPVPPTQGVALTVPGTCEGVRATAKIEIRWEGLLTSTSLFAVMILPSGPPPAPGGASP